MSDDFERASDREMAERELNIAHARAKNQPIKFSGRCLSCNAEIEVGRFCPGGECREDYEQELRIRRICGR